MIIQDGIITYMIPKGVEMVHSLADQVIGKPVFSYIHPDDQQAARERYGLILSDSDHPPLYDCRILTPEGRTIWIQMSSILINWDEKPAILNFLTDITVRKQTEEALSQVNRQLTLLGSITRHDILNLVNVLLLHLELFMMDCADSSLYMKYQTMLEVTKMIQSQIEFTRVYENLGIHKPVWQRLEGLIPKSKDPDRLHMSVHVSGYFVCADQMFSKVFDNLLDNSLRHGGRVTEIRVFTRLTDDGLVIVWEDNGSGIRKEHKKMIFDRGFGNNTGHGLFLIREILSITGISIHECGEEGKGVHFELHVPWNVYRYSGE